MPHRRASIVGGPSAGRTGSLGSWGGARCSRTPSRHGHEHPRVVQRRQSWFKARCAGGRSHAGRTRSDRAARGECSARGGATRRQWPACPTLTIGGKAADDETGRGHRQSPSPGEGAALRWPITMRYDSADYARSRSPMVLPGLGFVGACAGGGKEGQRWPLLYQ